MRFYKVCIALALTGGSMVSWMLASVAYNATLSAVHQPSCPLPTQAAAFPARCMLSSRVFDIGYYACSWQLGDDGDPPSLRQQCARSGVPMNVLHGDAVVVAAVMLPANGTTVDGSICDSMCLAMPTVNVSISLVCVVLGYTVAGLMLIMVFTIVTQCDRAAAAAGQGHLQHPQPVITSPMLFLEPALVALQHRFAPRPAALFLSSRLLPQQRRCDICTWGNVTCRRCARCEFWMCTTCVNSYIDSQWELRRAEAACPQCSLVFSGDEIV